MKSGSLERKKKKVLSEKGKKWFLTYRLLVQWRWPSPARLYNCHPRAGASEPELPTPVRSAAFCLECSRVHPHYAKVCSERQNCVLSENEEPVNTLPCLKGQISISSWWPGSAPDSHCFYDGQTPGLCLPLESQLLVSGAFGCKIQKRLGAQKRRCWELRPSFHRVALQPAQQTSGHLKPVAFHIAKGGNRRPRAKRQHGHPTWTHSLAGSEATEEESLSFIISFLHS